MKSVLWFLVVIATILVTGCEPKGPYPLSEEEVMRREKSLPGEIFQTAGDPAGPYREGPGSVGNENTAGSFYASTRLGSNARVTWPAVPGHYFEVHSYVNEGDQSFYVVRKVPAKEAR